MALGINYKVVMLQYKVRFIAMHKNTPYNGAYVNTINLTHIFLTNLLSSQRTCLVGGASIYCSCEEQTKVQV
jgi:hypothetical protein